MIDLLCDTLNFCSSVRPEVAMTVCCYRMVTRVILVQTVQVRLPLTNNNRLVCLLYRIDSSLVASRNLARVKSCTSLAPLSRASPNKTPYTVYTRSIGDESGVTFTSEHKKAVSLYGNHIDFVPSESYNIH